MIPIKQADPDHAKVSKVFINNLLKSLQVETASIEIHSSAINKSREKINQENPKLQGEVLRLLKRVINPKSHLAEFLNEKPCMPQEHHENYFEVLAIIISDLLQDDYGKTTQGGTSDIPMGPIKTPKVWESIKEDFIKILQEFFGVTPFLDTSRWDSIGFFVNAKWLSPNEMVK